MSLISIIGISVAGVLSIVMIVVMFLTEKWERNRDKEGKRGYDGF